MSEYICKEDLLKEIEKQYCYPCKEIIRAAFIDGCEICLTDEMKDKIKNFPAADIELVVHARWINHGSFVECSNCHEEQYGVDNFRFYCAHCGAKMDKE